MLTSTVRPGGISIWGASKARRTVRPPVATSTRGEMKTIFAVSMRRLIPAGESSRRHARFQGLGVGLVDIGLDLERIAGRDLEDDGRGGYHLPR